MQIDIQARGFTLTDALQDAVERRARAYRAAFPDLRPQLMVRLFDVNGVRGGIDKGCLLHARIGLNRGAVVATDVDNDLYHAIQAAFARLDRATRTTVRRRYRIRRDSPRRGDTRTALPTAKATATANVIGA
jgi:ribosome-associated translation inhibitor RaiA